MSGDHIWRLVAPWWAWGDDPQQGRGSAPLLQKFAADDFVEGFLKRPQHSLRFDDGVDRVQAVTLVGKPLPPAATEVVPLAELSKHSREVRLVASGPRKLFLPVHARHYLVSCELHCDAREFPSVDPAQVCNVGFVVRRLSAPVPRPLERELWRLQQRRDQAGAALNELLLRGPLRQHLDWLRRRRVEQLEARGELPAAQEQARQTLAAAEADLLAWRVRHGIQQQVEVWQVDGSDPDLGEWVRVDSDQQLAPGLEEQHFPMRRLHAPPGQPEHDAAGRTLYFGAVPTTADHRDRAGRPRFDDRSLYEIRCFVTRRRAACPRDRGFAGCRGERIWSLATEPYRLASPMDAVGCANRPITLRMPDLSELLAHAVSSQRGKLANVRVVHRQQIAPKGLDAAGTPGGPAICHFSIPLITLVAMFVLNLFLPIVVLLFNLWYLLAFRFCIGLPPSLSMGGDFLAGVKLANAVPPGGDIGGGVTVDGVFQDAAAARETLKKGAQAYLRAEHGDKPADGLQPDQTDLVRDNLIYAEHVNQPPLVADDEGRAIEPPLPSPAPPLDYLDVPTPQRRRVIPVRASA